MATTDGLVANTQRIVDAAEDRLRYLKRQGADHRAPAQINLIRTYGNRLSNYKPFDGLPVPQVRNRASHTNDHQERGSKRQDPLAL